MSLEVSDVVAFVDPLLFTVAEVHEDGSLVLNLHGETPGGGADGDGKLYLTTDSAQVVKVPGPSPQIGQYVRSEANTDDEGVITGVGGEAPSIAIEVLRLKNASVMVKGTTWYANALDVSIVPFPNDLNDQATPNT